MCKLRNRKRGNSSAKCRENCTKKWSSLKGVVSMEYLQCIRLNSIWSSSMLQVWGSLSILEIASFLLSQKLTLPHSNEDTLHQCCCLTPHNYETASKKWGCLTTLIPPTPLARNKHNKKFQIQSTPVQSVTHVLPSPLIFNLNMCNPKSNSSVS